MGGETTPGQKTPQLPPADIVDIVWSRHLNLTYMQKGVGPHNFFKQNAAKYVAQGDKLWVEWWGSDKTKWPFNTQCCATVKNYQMAICSNVSQPDPGPGPAPGPAPASCVAAVHAACPGVTGTACMTCCQAHHTALIKACPQGAPEMREACGSEATRDSFLGNYFSKY